MAEVLDSLRSGWLGTGPKVARFEKDFAAYKEVPTAVALNSCTAGLHLACLALDLEPGDEVITSPMTFCATVNTIVHAGDRPVLADVDGRTMNIDADAVRRAVTPRTRAILPVHFAGRPCAMDALEEIAREHDLKIIEDCAHAIETEYRGRKAGTIGDFVAFLDGMTRQKIGVGVHYRSIPEHPYYRKAFGWRPEEYPEAYRIGRQTVSLPISPKLSDEDVEDVIAAVRNLIA